jgi:hypothetical protein
MNDHGSEDMNGNRLEEWEDKLRTAFDAIDLILEDKYGGQYPLHPARPKRGTTANCKYDGLFSVGAAYSAGFGSMHGEGYVLEVRLVTLSHVPKTRRKDIVEEVVDLLREHLPTIFPDTELTVVRDGHMYKITGDLGLD